MARIVLDARAASGPASGVGRYIRSVVPELAAQAPQHEFIVLRRPDAPPVSTASNVRDEPVAGMSGTLPLVMSAGALRRVFRRVGRADLFHALFHLVPFGIRRGPFQPRRIVVTLHDLIWIDYARQVETNPVAAAWRRRLGLLIIPYALRVADEVICDSDATSDAAARWVSPERRTAVHLGVDAAFFEPDDGTPVSGVALATGAEYLAAFGVPKAYKNIGCLVRAFARLRAQRPTLGLVLIGGDGGVMREIQQAGLAPAVTVVRSASDRDVRAIIRHAKAFVVPSLVEGFGLPPLEAMALGTPVVVSDIPAFREVTGDAALRFAATDPVHLATVLNGLLSDGALRHRLVTEGRRRAASFRWSRTAAGILAVYERVLG